MVVEQVQNMEVADQLVFLEQMEQRILEAEVVLHTMEDLVL